MEDALQDRGPALKAVCSRKDLSDGVQLVAHAVSERNPLMILTHILIRAEIGGLHLSASDLELGISMVIPADVAEVGAATAPARLLSELVGSLPDGEVHISADRSHSLRVFCPGSDYRIVGLPPEEYPSLPDVEDEHAFRIAQSDLRAAIRQTAFAVSSEDKGRPILTGVLMDFETTTVTFVATDTTRLALRAVPVTEGRGATQAIVPVRALNEVLRSLADEPGDVEVRLTPKQAKFVTPGGVTVTTRLIEGQYPNYRRVVPTGGRIRLTMQTAAAQQAVRRASLVARHCAHRVEVRTHDDRLIMTAESSTEGSAHEEVELIRDGDDIEVALNSRYMLDVLSNMEQPGFVIEFTDALRPCVVRPKPEDEEAARGEYLCVLMPMQLS
ncbi:MAG: DNA polymerase III subunit beta [Armatimonadetes bacterium]|nr:DNA polymerase III subunit beta [Armatimonadota bacterium]